MGVLGSLIESDLARLCPGQDREYRVYTREHDLVEVPEADAGFDFRREIQELLPYVSGLRHRLLHTLAGKREARWLGDKENGRLDPRSLHRLLTGRPARIFRQRIQTEGGKAACTLLLDLSSSMSGRQIELCRQIALVFAETLNVIGFPTEIIGFSTLDQDLRSEAARDTGLDMDEVAKRFTRLVPLYHAVFKAFEEPWRRAAGRLSEVRCKALTPLGESLLFAGRRLAERPEARKVLFCLTDGQPVVGAWDEQVTMSHACWAVRRLSAAGIEPVGIGIREQCAQTIFPRHAVIQGLQELPTSFLRELCSVLGER